MTSNKAYIENIVFFLGLLMMLMIFLLSAII
jgi:hypothetical protein